MNKETLQNGAGKLVEDGKIMREILPTEGAYFGLDQDLVKFLNILAEGQIRANQLEERLKSHGDNQGQI